MKAKRRRRTGIYITELESKLSKDQKSEKHDLKKINNTDKSLVRIIKKGRKKAKISNIKVTRSNTYFERLWYALRDYEQDYAKNLKS